MKEVIQKCRELGSEVFRIYKKLVFERKEFEVSKEFYKAASEKMLVFDKEPLI